MKQAYKVPAENNGLEVRVGTDGVWLEFVNRYGQHVVFHVTSNLLDRVTPKGDVMREALYGWANDMVRLATEAAKNDRSDLAECDH